MFRGVPRLGLGERARVDERCHVRRGALECSAEAAEMRNQSARARPLPALRQRNVNSSPQHKLRCTRVYFVPAFCHICGRYIPGLNHPCFSDGLYFVVHYCDCEVK